MSLFNTLGTGASGLTASSHSLSVIGDNIANVGTTGFKSSRAYFADVFPQYLGSASGPAKLGRGAMLGGISTQFQQGSLQGTGGMLDVAINGEGFLPVSMNGEMHYTRDGAFQLDKDGFVVNMMGARVQGYSANNGVLTSELGDMQLDLQPLASQATSAITLDLNLANFDDATNGVDYAALTLDGTAAAATLEDVSTAADFTTSVRVFDSLGVGHDVTVALEAQPGGGYSWSAVIDGSEIDLDGDGAPDDPDGGAFEIANGTMTFDSDGELTGFTQTDTTTAWNWGAAGPFAFTLDVGLDGTGAPTQGSVRVDGSESFADRVDQNGFSAAGLVDLDVGDDGQIRGVYENGETRSLGGLAVVTFAAEQGLDRVGGNLFKASYSSGEPTFGTPGVGGTGTLVSRALERSTTDLESEFITMIQAQRSYQANAGVVRTADESLQELVNLV